MKTKITPLVLLVLLISACAPAVSQTETAPAPETISTEEPLSAPVPTELAPQPEQPVVTSWKAVRDQRYGFGLAMPCWWLFTPIPKDADNQELTRQSEAVVERLKHIKPGENAFNSNLPEHLKLQVKGAKISQIYKRLHPEKPSYTVTGSGGGGTHVYHWQENRALTNRERARLQTFPDNFSFCGTKESVRKQIGMAVPPRGAKVVFDAVLASLAGIDYPSINQNIIEDPNAPEKSHYIMKDK